MAVTSVATARSLFARLLGQVGRVALASQYPDDFEVYAFQIEVLNSKGETVQSLVFPVMPEDISYVNAPIDNVKQTQAGVAVLKSPVFVPLEMTVSGTFGRKFVMLQNNNILLSAAFAFSPTLTAAGQLVQNFRSGQRVNEFSKVIKTGYGVTRLLEKIVNLASSVDENGAPYRVLVYNLSFNQVWVVDALRMRINQNVNSNNMFWRYELSMRITADARNLNFTSEPSRTSLIRGQGIRNAVQSTATAIRSSLRRL